MLPDVDASRIFGECNVFDKFLCCLIKLRYTGATYYVLNRRFGKDVWNWN